MILTFIVMNLLFCVLVAAHATDSYDRIRGFLTFLYVIWGLLLAFGWVALALYLGSS